jgi:hypothetical protein
MLASAGGREIETRSYISDVHVLTAAQRPAIQPRAFSHSELHKRSLVVLETGGR